MKYRSTAGHHRGLSFREAFFSPSFMSDGGLILPETIPFVDLATLKLWRKLSYPDLVFEILKLYLSEDEIPHEILKILIYEALNTFTAKDILPVTRLKDGCLILEMFHGKTWAFKDLSLSLLGKFLEYFIKKDSTHALILVGTSGDTGSAVMEAVRSLKKVDAVVLLPKGLCTQVQERQMTTLIEDNLYVYRVEGNCDEFDESIKKCFTDSDFAEKHKLMSINSINWGRIMVQIAHHFYAYFKSCQEVGDTNVEIVIPTGGMGNATAGIIARKMGLPVRYVIAVSSNDVVERTLKTGEYVIAHQVHDTLAKAINVGKPYNMQRVVSLFTADDADVREFIEDTDRNERAKIPDKVLNDIRSIIDTYQGDDVQIRQTIRRCYDENQYILCPHTALAVAYHYQEIDKGNDKIRRICLATASPMKFLDAVESSGVPIPKSNAIDELMRKPTKFEEMRKGEDWVATLKEKIIEISQKY